MLRSNARRLLSYQLKVEFKDGVDFFMLQYYYEQHPFYIEVAIEVS